jgi:hypothetical protein
VARIFAALSRLCCRDAKPLIAPDIERVRWLFQAKGHQAEDARLQRRRWEERCLWLLVGAGM